MPLRGQFMHTWLPLPEQVAQVGWQSEHTAAELINSTKVLSGQAATHVEPCMNGALGSVQLRQASWPGPAHVPQGESQGMQMDWFAHFPTGVHVERHSLGGLEKGKAGEHETHEVDSGPEHVAQLSVAIGGKSR